MKQIKEPESSSNISLAASQLVSLAEFMHQARQESTENTAPAFDWLDFFKKFNVRPKDLLKARKISLKPVKATRLASGLTIEKTLKIVDALETALGSFKPGEKPYPTLNPPEIRVAQTSSGLEIQLPSSNQPGEINRQRELTRLLYLFVTGQELSARFPASQFDTLALQYPHTVNVLRQGWQDGYSSTRQLSGAFGWSLFRWENLPLTDEQIELARIKLVEKPKKEPVARQLDLPSAETRPANRGGFPGVLALVSLLIGLVLIVAFLVFSTANPTVTVQGKVTVAPTATIVPSPTAPTGLQNTRQADGVNLTRLNPAYLSQNEQKYVGPDSLVPGQAVRLNSQRNLRALNAEWSLGQNVYLTLQDGGWEVWDTVSGTRISRRELPDADQYAWVSWSPDGENFAAEGLDGKMRLGTGGRVLRTFPFAYSSSTDYYPEGGFFPLSWSPDSSMLMLDMNNGTKFQFWSFKGTPQQIMAPNNQPTLDLKAVGGMLAINHAIWSWSGDSRYIAFYLCDGFNEVDIYDSHTLEKAGSFSFDQLLSLPSGSIYVDQYNAKPNQGNFAWSPDGKYMGLQRWIKGPGAGDNGYKRVLMVWDVPSFVLTMRDAYPYTPNSFQIINLDNPDSANLIAWSRNNRLLIDSRQVETVNNGPVVKANSLQVYDLGIGDDFNWTQTFSILLPELPYDARAWWAPDGQRILTSDDLGYLAIYDIPSQRSSTRTVNVRVLSKTVDDQIDMAVPSPDGKWLATFSKTTGPQLRDLKTGKPSNNFSYSTSNGTISYKWSPDSRFLALVYSWSDGTSYNPHTKTVARIWQFDNSGPQPAVYSDVLISTNADFVPQVDWNSKSAVPELIYEQDQNNVGLLPLTKGATLPNGQGNTPATPASAIASLTPNASAVSVPGQASVTVTPPDPTPTLTPAIEARFGTGNPDSTLLDVTNPVVISIPTPRGGTSNPAGKQAGSLSARSNISQFWTVPRAWAADWAFLVGPLDNTRDYGILKLMPADSKDKATEIAFQPSTEKKPEKATIKAAAVSPDGRMVALGFDNGLVQLYNSTNGKLFQAYSAHQAAVTVLSFSPDSKSLATGSADHTVKVWETTNWKNTAMLRGQTRPVAFLQWLPDSKTLISNSSDPNSTVMWRVS